MTADLWANTVVVQAGLRPGTPLAEAVGRRAKVMGLTQEAERAVVAPLETGAFPHDLRAALACRIARLNRKEELAAYYRAKITDPNAQPEADPGFAGADPRAQAILRFTDRVATRPRDAGTPDITALQDAGLADADIVRLAELNAFLAYQIRVIDGLALLRQEAAA